MNCLDDEKNCSRLFFSKNCTLEVCASCFSRDSITLIRKVHLVLGKILLVKRFTYYYYYNNNNSKILRKHVYVEREIEREREMEYGINKK